jgi:hypothetical protein
MATYGSDDLYLSKRHSLRYSWFMLTLEKLERTLHIRKTIDTLQEELHSIYSSIVGAVTPAPAKGRGRKRRKKRKAVKRAKTLGNTEGGPGPVVGGPPGRPAGKKKSGPKKKRKISAAGKVRAAAKKKKKKA